VSDTLTLPDPSTPMGAALSAGLGCSDEADAIALRSFRDVLHVEAKPDRTFVTQVDRSIEELVRARLADAFPEDGFVGEEYGTQAGTSGRRWYIDPIDGTHNYMRGIPLFGSLLALEVGDELTIGIMSAPALGRRWLAWRGGGAWAVDLREGTWSAASARRLEVSAIGTIESSQILYSSLPEVLRSGLVPGFTDVLSEAWRDRGLGDFWGYALVAEGAAEAMVEIGVKPWDLAAAVVVVEEAGGRLTDLEGRRTIHGASVLATNGRLHDELLERLARPRAEAG
jgi:histidinol-phosphatase